MGIGAADIHLLIPLRLLVRHTKEATELRPTVLVEQLFIGGDEAALQAEALLQDRKCVAIVAAQIDPCLLYTSDAADE